MIEGSRVNEMLLLSRCIFFLLLAVPGSMELNFTDLGSRDSCEMPAVSLCAGVVDYKVPVSVARQVAFIESNLEMYSTGLSGNDRECFDWSKRALCTQVFPRCSEDQVIFEAEANCQSELNTACSAGSLQGLDLEVVCSTRSFSLVSSCHSLREHSESSAGIGHCTLPLQTVGDLQLSDWMYHHMAVFGAFLTLDALRSFPCFSNHWRYLCYYGECSGSRLRTRATRKDCDSATNWSVFLNSFSYLFQAFSINKKALDLLVVGRYEMKPSCFVLVRYNLIGYVE